TVWPQPVPTKRPARLADPRIEARPKGPPTALFVAIGVVIILLLGGVLAMQFLGHKPAPAPAGPTIAATPPAQPTPAPAPTSSRAAAAPATTRIEAAARPAPEPHKPRSVAEAAPRPEHHSSSIAPGAEADVATPRTSHVPDEGDAAPN
ncbi:MAG TPA: hypothetical protein VG939_05625, partial [Caulobacteraceae bacterium]|nr:hypothetical protein [Caulobacteraceae bacterium]